MSNELSSYRTVPYDTASNVSTGYSMATTQSNTQTYKQSGLAPCVLLKETKNFNPTGLRQFKFGK